MSDEPEQDAECEPAAPPLDSARGGARLSALQDPEGALEGPRGGVESPPLTEEAIREIIEERRRQRIQRVLEVMRRERIDWRGVPFVTPDGRIAVRVVPVEMAPEEQ